MAAGAIARKWLAERYGVAIRGYMAQLGPMEIDFKTWDSIGENPFFSPDPDIVPELESFMDRLRKSGDSCGARIRVVASGVPVGWGEPDYDKLDSDLAYALMSINAVKGVEIGDGFASAALTGEQNADEMSPGKDGKPVFASNHAGGTAGGISTGQPVVCRVAFKPTSSILTPVKSITSDGEATEVVTKGRHDPCVGIRAVPVGEAMMACVLADHLLRHRAQCGME